MARFVPLSIATAGAAAALLLGLQAGSHAQGLDPCLVGVWQRDGNGAVEWMRRNMPGMSISWQGTGGVLELKADGSYAAGGAGAGAARSTLGDTMQAQAEVQARTAGRWSAADGTLTLSPTSETISGQMQITTPGGSHQMPMPGAGETRPMQYAYTCSDAAMETRMQFPGMTDPLVQRYTRAETAGQ